MSFRVIAPGTLVPERPSPRPGPELSGPERLRLLQAVGSALAPELFNLLEESQPELRAEGLFALAESLSHQGNRSAAAEIFSLIVSEAANPSWVGRARRRLQAILGQGPVAGRFEDLARNFVSQATDPTMILSFGIAGTVANGLRLSAAGALASRSASWMTRGLAARFASGFLGYAAEVPTFVAARRSLASLAGNDEAGPTLSQELSSAALFLGTVQATSFFGSALLRNLRPNATPSALWNSAVGLGGVYLGQRVEEYAGLRPVASEANRWTNAADTWLQMRVGGCLLSGVGSAESLDLSRASLLQLGLREGLADERLSHGEFLEAHGLPAAYMSRAEDSRLDNYSQDPQISALAEAWGEELARPSTLRAAMKIGLDLEALEPVTQLLRETSVRDPERLEISLNRLAFMIEHSRPRGVRGNYAEWLARLAFSAALRQNTRDPRHNPLQVTSILHVDNLLDRLYSGDRLDHLEELLLPLFPQYRIQPMERRTLRDMGQALHSLVSSSAIPKRIAALTQLGTPARDMLLQLNRHLGRLNKQDPLYQDMGIFLDNIERAFREREDLIPDIERAISAASNSPLAYLRLYRLSRILYSQLFTYPKLVELSGAGIRLQAFHDRTRNPMTAEAVDGTQANAFYDEEGMAENFAEFYRQMDRYLDPAQVSRRERRRHSIMERFWPKRRTMDLETVLATFDALGDSQSQAVAASVRSGEVSLEILDSRAFNAEVDRYIGDQRGHHYIATMIPGKDGARNRILVRQLSPEAYSPEVFKEFVFRRLSYIVHEYEHHLHTDPDLEYRASVEIMRQEIRATHREIHFNAEHGDISQLEQITERAATGWAMYLRSMAEGIYIKFQNPED